MFNNLFKNLKLMAKNNKNKPDEVVEETTNETPTETTETAKVAVERELTQEVLDKAIESFKSENPDKNWDEVDQQTRWDYLEKAY